MSKALSIKQLLLLAFLLAGLLPAMLVSFLSFSQASNALRKEILRDLQTSGATVATDVDRVMFERLQNVHSWSQLALMQEVLIGDVDKRLSVFFKRISKKLPSRIPCLARVGLTVPYDRIQPRRANWPYLITPDVLVFGQCRGSPAAIIQNYAKYIDDDADHSRQQHAATHRLFSGRV
jgi:hypothetical protein